ncbi:pneumococcal serine-rich repeat protein-like isoform X2 [Lineus longissimus]|uniref:pneumococcal serine-rich repeat protein-like isoform X2 n=1 Tax=Lineus longissimus TaxID=88925 RepID=UPI00315D1289
MALKEPSEAERLEIAPPKRALEVERFSTLEEVHEKIRELEKEGATKYASRAKHKNFGDERVDPADLLKNHRIYDHLNGVASDGCPFFNLGSKRWGCHLGKQQTKSKRYDPAGVNVRRRNTKKVDCPVVIWVKHIMKFPQFKITDQQHTHVDKYRKNVAVKKVRQLLESAQDLKGQCVHEFYMNIPQAEDHKGHPISGITAGFRHQLEPRVVAVMNDAIRLGVNRVSHINNIIYSFVKKEFFPKKKPDKMDKRFFPTKVDVRNYLARFNMSNTDKQNTENFVSKWQQNIIEDFIYFRPHYVNLEIPYIPHPKACFKNILDIPDLDRMRRNVANDTSAPLLFCYQSVWQKRLMSLHGNQMTFLNPAHLALPCEYPLYFLVVLTNVGFLIVGVIILEKSSPELLQEALSVFRNWNPGWKPSTFMVGSDEDDASAIQAVFKEKGIRLHINKDHREKAWRAWQDDASDGIENKGEIIEMMREIATSPSREKLKKALETLHESEAWKGDALLRHWFTETWENRIKQWTTVYLEKTLDLMMNVCCIKDSMTELLVHKPIRPYRSDTLLEMITQLLKSYLPKSYIKYTKMNVDTPVDMTKMRALPEFLRNSPAATVVGESVTSVATSSNWLSMGLFIVSKTEPGMITVEIIAGQREEVRLGNAEKFPSCTCAAWNASRLPCIHFFSVVRCVPSVNWESFSPLYRDCLLFQTDYSCNTVLPYTPDRDVSADVVLSDDEEVEEEDDVIESNSEANDAGSDIDYGGAISDSPPNSPEVAQAVHDLLLEEAHPETPSVSCSTTTPSDDDRVDTVKEPAHMIVPVIVSVRSLISTCANVPAAVTSYETSAACVLAPSAQAKVSPSCQVNLSALTKQVQKIIKPKAAESDKEGTPVNKEESLRLSNVQEGVSTDALVEVPTSSSVAMPTAAVAENSSIASTATAVACSSDAATTATGLVKPLDFSTTASRQQISTMANGSTIVVEAMIPGKLPSVTRFKRNTDGTYIVDKSTKFPSAVSIAKELEKSIHGDTIKKPVPIAPAVGTSQSVGPVFAVAVTSSSDLLGALKNVVSSTSSPTVIKFKKPLDLGQVDSEDFVTSLTASGEATSVGQLPIGSSLMSYSPDNSETLSTALFIPTTEQTPDGQNVPSMASTSVASTESPTTADTAQSGEASVMSMLDDPDHNEDPNSSGSSIVPSISGTTIPDTSTSVAAATSSGLSSVISTVVASPASWVPLQKYLSAAGNKPIIFTTASSASSLPILTNIPVIHGDAQTTAAPVSSDFPLLVSTTNLATTVTRLATTTVTTMAPASSATTASATSVVTSATVSCPPTALQILQRSQSTAKALTKLATASTSQSPQAKIPNILSRGKAKSSLSSALPLSSQSSDVTDTDDDLEEMGVDADDSADWTPDLEIDLPKVAKPRSSTRIKSLKNTESPVSKADLSDNSQVQEKLKYDKESATGTKTTSGSAPNQTTTASTSVMKPTLVTIIPSEPGGTITEKTLSGIMDMLKKKGVLKGQKVCFNTPSGESIASCESGTINVVSEHSVGASVSQSSSGTTAPSTSLGTPLTRSSSGKLIAQKSRGTPVSTLSLTSKTGSSVSQTAGARLQGTSQTVVPIPKISASAVTPVFVQPHCPKGSMTSQSKVPTVASLLQKRAATNVQSGVSIVATNMQSKGSTVSGVESSGHQMCVKPCKPATVMVSASTQTMEMPAVEKTKKAPKTKKQKLIRKCEETLKNVGDTLQLVKDEEYLTQLNDHLYSLLGELREIVSMGRIGPSKQVKQELVLETILSVPETVPVPEGPSPSKRMRLEQPVEVDQNLYVTSAGANYQPNFPSQSTSNETYYEVEYVEVPQSEIEPAVASIKLEGGIDNTGIQRILDALNVVSQEEVVGCT